MDVLRAAGVTLDDVRTVQPDLEEVFVGVTGMEVDVSQGVNDGGRSS